MAEREVRKVGTEDLTSVLDGAGARYDVLPHAHTETAADEAEALGLAPADVAKTLVVTTPEGYVRAVLPASERIDLGKLSQIVGERKKALRLASEEELERDYPDFELGAVPPVGGARRDPVVLDARLAERESIVFEAGSHDESVRLAPSELVRIAGAQVADICLEGR
jgi:Ala-tRNA(Pro) deacylase